MHKLDEKALAAARETLARCKETGPNATNQVALEVTCKRLLDHLDSLSALAPSTQPATAAVEGWKLVPVEPTDAMHNAARDWAVKKYGQGVGKDGSDGCYRAMIAAAPPRTDAEALSNFDTFSETYVKTQEAFLASEMAKISDVQIVAMVIAHDTEEAAMRGEPPPWDEESMKLDEFQDRIACMKIALRALS